MKKRNSSFIATLGLAAVIMTGCSSLPQEGIDAANEAFEEAKTGGAELYVPDAYYALQDSLNSVMEGIEARKSKFIKNFRNSEEQLAGVTLQAQEVINQTETRKEELKNEIKAILEEAVILLESNRQLILEAPRGKEGTTVLMAIGQELNTLEESINSTTSMVEKGEYLAGLVKATAAKDNASSINAELTEVIAKYKANVRNR